MKEKILLAIIATILSVSNVAFAQEATDATSENPTWTLDVESRYGIGGFAPLFGINVHEKWGAFVKMDLQHRSGFGIGGYRYEDFKQEGLGRTAFVDLYWAGKIAKNLSLYGAIEYTAFDNDKTMSFVAPYVMVSWENKVVNIYLTPIYCYYDKLGTDEFILLLRVMKSPWKGGEVSFSGWYNNTLNKKLYGAIGINQKLLGGFSVRADWLFREGKAPLTGSVVYKITFKK